MQKKTVPPQTSNDPPTLIRADFVFLYFVFLPFITETLSLKGERQSIII